MKNVTWMEVAIAMPMVLTLSTAGGKLAVIIAAIVLTAGMAVIKWGKHITLEKKQIAQPVLVKVG